MKIVSKRDGMKNLWHLFLSFVFGVAFPLVAELSVSLERVGIALAVKEMGGIRAQRDGHGSGR